SGVSDPGAVDVSVRLRVFDEREAALLDRARRFQASKDLERLAVIAGDLPAVRADAEQAYVRYREARDAYEGVRGDVGNPSEVIRGAREAWQAAAVHAAPLIARFEAMRVEG